MPASRAQRIEQFLDYYGAIHALDDAYATREALAGHRAAAENLFAQSEAFVGTLPWDAIGTALDVGMGYGLHCAEFARRGAATTGVTVHLPHELAAHAREHGYAAERQDMHFLDFADGSFDLVWASHTLEHSFAPLLALREWIRVCRPGGWVCVTVPPHVSRIVSGHFTTGWSVGQLAYMLALAGLDCRDGRFVKEGYNVRGLVQRPATPLSDEGASWMFNLKDRLPRRIAESMTEHPGSLGRFFYEGALDAIEPEPMEARP
ncbi:MAG: class I SAM-dependent methyltransferase [Phycisphaerales bacterium]